MSNKINIELNKAMIAHDLNCNIGGEFNLSNSQYQCICNLLDQETSALRQEVESEREEKQQWRDKFNNINALYKSVTASKDKAYEKISELEKEKEKQSELIKHLQDQAFNDSIELERYRLVTVPEIEKENKSLQASLLDVTRGAVEYLNEVNTLKTVIAELSETNQSLSARVSELEGIATEAHEAIKQTFKQNEMSIRSPYYEKDGHYEVSFLYPASNKAYLMLVELKSKLQSLLTSPQGDNK